VNEPGPSPDPLYAPHGEPGRFFCPWKPWTSRRADLLRWKLGKNPYAEDKKTPPRIPVVANDGAYLRNGGEPPSVTWVGHSTFAVEDGGDVFVTDPHWGRRALVPPRVTPPGIPLGSIPDDAFALLSHNHYDHMDAWTIRRLPKTVRWFVPLGLGAWVRKQGYERVEELDWWQSARHGRWTITFLPAQHWSNRLGMARNSTLWGSFLVDSGERRYYFGADSGYFHGFAEFGRKFDLIDVAFLPIGAYEPRWFMKTQHMDPEEAYRAFQDLQARVMVSMHWGCFDLTDEPVDRAPKVLEEILAREGADRSRVWTMAVGERRLLPER
jgi:N-acyl-phosphatidylethanolamine-hydrolysing phospholipase D